METETHDGYTTEFDKLALRKAFSSVKTDMISLDEKRESLKKELMENVKESNDDLKKQISKSSSNFNSIIKRLDSLEKIIDNQNKGNEKYFAQSQKDTKRFKEKIIQKVNQVVDTVNLVIDNNEESEKLTDKKIQEILVYLDKSQQGRKIYEKKTDSGIKTTKDVERKIYGLEKEIKKQSKAIEKTSDFSKIENRLNKKIEELESQIVSVTSDFVETNKNEKKNIEKQVQNLIKTIGLIKDSIEDKDEDHKNTLMTLTEEVSRLNDEVESVRKIEKTDILYTNGFDKKGIKDNSTIELQRNLEKTKKTIEQQDKVIIQLESKLKKMDSTMKQISSKVEKDSKVKGVGLNLFKKQEKAEVINTKVIEKINSVIDTVNLIQDNNVEIERSTDEKIQEILAYLGEFRTSQIKFLEQEFKKINKTAKKKGKSGKVDAGYITKDELDNALDNLQDKVSDIQTHRKQNQINKVKKVLIDFFTEEIDENNMVPAPK